MLRFFKQYYPVRNAFFVVGEALLLFFSVLCATWIVVDPGSMSLDIWLWLKAFLITVICQACLYYNDLYDLKVTNSFRELGVRLLQALGVAAILLAGVYSIFPKAIIGKGIFALSTGLLFVLVLAWRFFYTTILYYGIFNQKLIILGSGTLARNIIEEIEDKKDCGYTVSVVVPELLNDELETTDEKNQTFFRKGDYSGLCELAKELKIKKIVVALKEKRGGLPITELLRCRIEGIDILDGISFYETLTGKLIVQQINPSWLIFSEGFKKSLLKRCLKRLTDIVLSAFMLLFFSPLIILTAILIKLDSEGPILFAQDRVGEKGKIYTIYKFRSMVVNAEKKSGPVWTRSDDDRITRVGRFIRKLRIDEIPQLWNVLKGNMSFVGPRPEREFFVRILEEKIPYYGERFSVRPGVTGWAQVSYGYGASVEDAVEKLNYDLFYIKNMSIFMDLMIIMRTIKIVLFGVGAR
jgi:sugar transferase (PEP-CTERM system associated)